MSEDKEAMSPDEIDERNRLQIVEALSYRHTAELMEDRELTDNEVILWYIRIGLAKMFEVDWREGKNPANLWYTGIEHGHPPSRIDAYEHWRRYADWELTRRTCCSS